jgi:hypothetical protein
MAQTKIGWRAYVATTTTTTSTLLTSLYSVWNADTLGTSLDTSIYGVYNGDNVNDTSGNARNGTNVNGVTFTTGKVGNAFTFNGSNYVSLPNNLLNFTGDFSYSLWVNLTNLTGLKPLINNFDEVGPDYRGNMIFILGNVLYYRISYSNPTPIDLTYTYPGTNQWVHVVVTRKASTRSRMYINGTLVISNTSTINPTYYPTMPYNTIGAYYDNNGWRYLKNGDKVDAVTAWSKELTSDEITQLYNAGTGAEYPFSGQTLPSFNNQFAIDNGTSPSGSAPTFTDGKIGKAFLFDGVNDYVEFPNNSLNFNSSFSVSFWIYNNNMATNQNRRYIACSYYLSGNYGYGWQFARWVDGKYVFYCFNGDGVLNSIYMTTEDIIPVNQWTHITITRKWSTETRIYVNGVYKNFTYSTGNATINPGYSSTMYCTIGALKDNPSNISSYINGRIDGLNVWQKELTQAEVTELYNSGNGKQLTVATPIVTNGLVLNLDASRTSSYPNAGTTWTDISGNGNNGTMVNGPIFGTASGGQITFDGVNDYVEMGTITSLNLINISISVWVKPTTITDYIPVIGRYHNTTTYNGWELYYFKSTNKFYFGGRESSSSYLQVMSNNTYSINNWYNITGVKSGNVWSLYVNGVLDNSLTLGSGTIAFGTNSIQIGGLITSGASYYGKSDISQSIIYNRALSQSEITQNFNATKFRFGL